MFGRYLSKMKSFWMQFHFVVVSTFLKACVKDHGDSSQWLPKKKEDLIGFLFLFFIHVCHNFQHNILKGIVLIVQFLIWPHGQCK